MARAAALALAAVLVAACGAHKEPVVPATLSGLGVDRPASWHEIRDPVCGFLGRGVSFTNDSRLSLHAYHLGGSRTECSNFWDLRSAPRSFVLVDVEEFDSAPPSLPPGEPRDTPLPPALEVTPYVAGIRPAPPRMCWCTFRAGTAVVHGDAYSIRTWEGYGSSERDRRLAREIVASIRRA